MLLEESNAHVSEKNLSSGTTAMSNANRGNDADTETDSEPESECALSKERNGQRQFEAKFIDKAECSIVEDFLVSLPELPFDHFKGIITGKRYTFSVLLLPLSSNPQSKNKPWGKGIIKKENGQKSYVKKNIFPQIFFNFPLPPTPQKNLSSFKSFFFGGGGRLLCRPPFKFWIPKGAGGKDEFYGKYIFPVIGIDERGTIWALPESRYTIMDRLQHNITKMSNIESPLTIAKGDIFVYKVLLLLSVESKFRCLNTKRAVKKAILRMS